MSNINLEKKMVESKEQPSGIIAENIIGVLKV